MANKEINENDPRFRVTPIQQMTAACTGALATSLIMTPLDVVRIRLQVQQKKLARCFTYCNGLMDHLCPCIRNDETIWYRRPSKFNGTLDAIIKISKREGLPSLWSGLSPTLVLALPATVFFFVSYEQLRIWLNDQFGYQQIQPLWVPFASACITRFWCTVIVSPLELIRTKMQSQNLSYLEVNKALQSLVHYQGYKGLLKGLSPTLLRDVPFSGIYWLGYEGIKSKYPDSKMTFFGSFLAGTIAGSVASIITSPFDVVKTHQQVEWGNEIYREVPMKHNTTMFTVIQNIYIQHGVRGLFTGSVPRTMRVAPACAIMIAIFEHGKSFFEAYNLTVYKNKT